MELPIPGSAFDPKPTNSELLRMGLELRDNQEVWRNGNWELELEGPIIVITTTITTTIIIVIIVVVIITIQGVAQKHRCSEDPGTSCT